MTKLAVLSDIHGNLPALEAVLADLKNFDVNQVIVPGDVVHFGPFSRQTTEIVIGKNWPVVRGNNEYFLLDYGTARAPAEWNDPVQFAPTAWLSRQFDQSLKDTVATWPDSINLRFQDAPPIQVFHGRPQSPWEPIYFTFSDDEISHILSEVEAEYVICGHTHLPMDRQTGKRRVFNPGSVGLPLDGIFSASYMLLEGNEHGWTPTFRRVPFDYEVVYDEFEKSGFNRECGPIGRLMLEIYKTARPQFGFVDWRRTHHPDSPVSFELVEQYVSEGKWWEFQHPAYHTNMS